MAIVEIFSVRVDKRLAETAPEEPAELNVKLRVTPALDVAGSRQMNRTQAIAPLIGSFVVFVIMPVSRKLARGC